MTTTLISLVALGLALVAVQAAREARSDLADRDAALLAAVRDILDEDRALHRNDLGDRLDRERRRRQRGDCDLARLIGCLEARITELEQARRQHGGHSPSRN